MKEKRWVKYLCLFALTFVLALSAAGTKQAQAATKSGSCGDKATYTYDTSTKTLTISGSGTVGAPSYWSKISGSVKKLVVGDKITDIGEYMNWSALKTVTLGAKVKSINDQAFVGCSSLTTVDMGDSAVTKIGMYAFVGCEKLKTVTFSKKLTKIGDGAFNGCTKLTSISLPSSLKTIGEGAFESSGLTKVTIPKNVTSIGSSAFSGDSLTKIAVSSSNTKYSAKSGVLYNKAKTKLITYPAGKSSSSFTVPGTVTAISAYAFVGASSLKSINLNKVKKIGGYAFYGSGLKKITIPKSVTSIGTCAFCFCNSLTKIAVSGSNTKYSAKDGVLYNKAKTKLIAYPGGKTDTSFTVPSTVKTIFSQAFAANQKLKQLTIGSNVTEIRSFAFYNCSKLKSVSVDAKTIGVYAFGSCSKLKTVVIGANVKNIGGDAFAMCNSLTAVRFKGSAPDFEESTISSESGEEDTVISAFDGVGELTIKYPSSETSSWTKTLRSKLKEAAEVWGGTLTFEAY